jgi:hypothetical protein
VFFGPVGNQSPNGLIIWYIAREKVNLMSYCSGFLFYWFDNKNTVGDVDGPDEICRPTSGPYKIDLCDMQR